MNIPQIRNYRNPNLALLLQLGLPPPPGLGFRQSALYIDDYTPGWSGSNSIPSSEKTTSEPGDQDSEAEQESSPELPSDRESTTSENSSPFHPSPEPSEAGSDPEMADLTAELTADFQIAKPFDGKGELPAHRWLTQLRFDFKRSGIPEPTPAQFFEAVNVLLTGEASNWYDSHPKTEQWEREGNIAEFEAAFREKYPKKAVEDIPITDSNAELEDFKQKDGEALTSYYHRGTMLLKKTHGRYNIPHLDPPLQPIEKDHLERVCHCFVKGLQDPNLMTDSISCGALMQGSLLKTLEIVQSTQKALQIKHQAALEREKAEEVNKLKRDVETLASELKNKDSEIRRIKMIRSHSSVVQDQGTTQQPTQATSAAQNNSNTMNHSNPQNRNYDTGSRYRNNNSGYENTNSYWYGPTSDYKQWRDPRMQQRYDDHNFDTGFGRDRGGRGGFRGNRGGPGYYNYEPRSSANNNSEHPYSTRPVKHDETTTKPDPVDEVVANEKPKPKDRKEATGEGFYHPAQNKASSHKIINGSKPYRYGVGLICFKCGQNGHISNGCTNPSSLNKNDRDALSQIVTSINADSRSAGYVNNDVISASDLVSRFEQYRSGSCRVRHTPSLLDLDPDHTQALAATEANEAWLGERADLTADLFRDLIISEENDEPSCENPKPPAKSGDSRSVSFSMAARNERKRIRVEDLLDDTPIRGVKAQKAPKVKTGMKPRVLREIRGRDGEGPLNYRKILSDTMISISILDLFQASPEFAKESRKLSSRINHSLKKYKPPTMEEAIHDSRGASFNSQDFTYEAPWIESESEPELEKSTEALSELEMEPIPGTQKYNARSCAGRMIFPMTKRGAEISKLVLPEMEKMPKPFRIPVVVRTESPTTGSPKLKELSQHITAADQGSDMNLISDVLADRLELKRFPLTRVGIDGFAMRCSDGGLSQLYEWVVLEIGVRGIWREVWCMVKTHKDPADEVHLLLGLPWLSTLR